MAIDTKTYRTVKIEREGNGITWVILNRPEKRNAMNPTMHFEMVDVLIKEFERKKTHPWYQMRLAEAMAGLEMQTNVQEQAVILQALTKAVVDLDHSRAAPVRAQAAMSLGRAALPRARSIPRAVA